jgi:oligopeptide transport system substrate-binding protein
MHSLRLLVPRFAVLATLAVASGLPITVAAAAPKILHVSIGAEPPTIDTQLANGIPETRLVRALNEGLVRCDAEMKVVPALAQSWEVSPDGLTYTFHLRPETRWSDGRPITAEDFVRSYRRALTAELGCQDVGNLYCIAGAEDFHRGKSADFATTGIRALGPHTLEIRLHQPATFFLYHLTQPEFGPVPLHVVEKHGPATQPGNRWTRPENFVGNGPFVLKSWRDAQKIVVTRSPTYWNRAHVKLDEIHFYPIDNSGVEERMFRTGQLHLTAYVPVAKIATYRRDLPDALRTEPYGGLYYYVFNTQRAPFTDVRVRRALALAIDREQLVKQVTLGGERPAYRAVPPGLQGYEGSHAFRVDLAAARKLLGDAGFPGGKGLPPVELLYNTSENHRAIAEAIQQMWRRHLGVEVTLANQEWKVYLDVINKTRTHQIARAGWVSAEPHIHLEKWSTGHANNSAQWSHAGYDRLLREATAARTTAERYDRYREMERILNDEMPIIPIYSMTMPRLVSPKVVGYRTTMDDSFPWQDVDLVK